MRAGILFGHLNGPDTGAGAYVEDAPGIVERGEMKVATGQEQGDMMLDVDAVELLLQDSADVSLG